MSKLQNSYCLETDDFFKSNTKKTQANRTCQSPTVFPNTNSPLGTTTPNLLLLKGSEDHFFVRKQHKCIQLIVITCLLPNVKVLIRKLETKTQLMLMKKDHSLKGQGVHH